MAIGLPIVKSVTSEWNIGVELRRLIRSNHELCDLYKTLLYRPDGLIGAKRIVTEGRFLIQSDQSDYPGFESAMSERLDELEQLVPADREANPKIDEVLEAIADLRTKVANRKAAQLPVPLRYSNFYRVWCPTDGPAAKRGEQLDDILQTLILYRREQKDREPVLRAASNYLNGKWMHGPWLTNYVLLALLDMDLAPLKWSALNYGEHKDKPPPMKVLLVRCLILFGPLSLLLIVSQLAI